MSSDDGRVAIVTGGGSRIGAATAKLFRRFAQAAGIAEAVLFLASDAAAYITGEEIVIDGGVSVGVPIEATP